ncbi:protein phosphatase 1 regulatory subunit 3C-B-like [Pholidichthys leucotaenia]
MKCTRVLQVLNPHPQPQSPVMPADVAVRVCLAGSPPLHTFLSNCDNPQPSAATIPTCCRPLRPCLSSGRCSEDVTTELTSTIEGAETSQVGISGKEKKSVMFADSQGLALTAIHVYDESEEEELAELQFTLTELEGATAELKLDHIKDSADSGPVLVLDFTPPAEDYLNLRNRLKAQQVCLETCSVQDHLVSGTIQVRNLCFEKSVLVRFTFDSWRSFQDVGCQYLNNVYGCPDTDTFSFSVSVPEVLEPSSGIEFCIQFQTPDQTFWDNNLGNNYRLLEVDLNSHQSPNNTSGIQTDRGGEQRKETEIDPLGSPRTSAGAFPEWQSWGPVETGTPYW